MSGRSHYDVLGVAPWATPADIQHAYRDRARLLHPDHLASHELSPVDRAQAELRIREVNEAWRVLRDPEARAAYDERRRTGAAPPRADGDATDEPWWPGPFVTPGPQPPRRRPAHAVLTTDDPPLARRLGVLVWIGLGIVLAVIFVSTAYLGGGSSTPGHAPTTEAVTGTCVRVSAGPTAVAVPCSGPNDGRIVGAAMSPADCPPGSEGRRIQAGDPGVTCLAATP